MLMKKVYDDMPEIKQVIYSDPVTVVIWGDGTKTKSRCDEDDIYDELTGFMLCVFKKLMTPKAMRKMFKDYVYNVDSKKIKWQSEPTWLEYEGWADEFISSLTIDDEATTRSLKDAFNVGEFNDDKVVANLVEYILNHGDKGYIYVL